MLGVTHISSMWMNDDCGSTWFDRNYNCKLSSRKFNFLNVTHSLRLAGLLIDQFQGHWWILMLRSTIPGWNSNLVIFSSQCLVQISLWFNISLRRNERMCVQKNIGVQYLEVTEEWRTLRHDTQTTDLSCCSDPDQVVCFYPL